MSDGPYIPPFEVRVERLKPIDEQVKDDLIEAIEAVEPEAGADADGARYFSFGKDAAIEIVSDFDLSLYNRIPMRPDELAALRAENEVLRRDARLLNARAETLAEALLAAQSELRKLRGSDG